MQHTFKAQAKEITSNLSDIGSVELAYRILQSVAERSHDDLPPRTQSEFSDALIGCENTLTNLQLCELGEAA